MDTRRILRGVLCLILLAASTMGYGYSSLDDKSFTVKNIEIEGNKRISRATVLSYLTLQKGDRFSQQKSANVLRDLYSTGFFDKVSLYRKDHTLVIKVRERPVIGQLNIDGNEMISRQQIMTVLKKAGIQEGDVLEPANLQAIRQSLLQQYYNQGHYNAEVNIEQKRVSASRVRVHIHIDEGKAARISRIKIIGNNKFAESTLLKQFSLKRSSWWNYFSSSDQYSKQKLQADLKSLKQYYMDRGYLNFNIEGSQVSITPDKKHVYIVIKITEGKPYRVGHVNITGSLPEDVDQAELRQNISIRKGRWFSRQQVVDSEQAMGDYLGNLGYANARIQPKPSVDTEKHQVNIDFDVKTGNHVYVNQVKFEGNRKTQDDTLRKQLRQPESGLLRTNDIDETKRKLKNLGYVKNVEVQTVPVGGDPSMQDLTYTLQEANSATANLQIAFSDAYGVMYGADITDKNFRGTGKHVSISANHDRYKTDLDLDYYNPNYTMSGISRGFNLHSTRKTPKRIKLSHYKLDKYGGSVTYGVPITDYTHMDAKLGYDRYALDLSSNSPREIKNFKQKHGNHFNGLELHLGLDRRTLDRAIFPTKGTKQSLNFSLGIPVGDEALEYYKTSYEFHGWQPLFSGFILHGRAGIGYGDGYGDMDDLPFFLNYYAGGIHSVRGYEGNTLGPKDSGGNSIGGRMMTDFSVGLILPKFKDSVRTTAFFDGGAAYEKDIKLDDLRYSAGVQAQWYSPMGPLLFSIAEPINDKDTDDTQLFQFSVGTSF